MSSEDVYKLSLKTKVKLGINSLPLTWISIHEDYYLLNFISYYTLTGSPYHGNLLLLLSHVVIVVNLWALWKIDVYLISTLVNKSLYYYYYYYYYYYSIYRIYNQLYWSM